MAQYSVTDWHSYEVNSFVTAAAEVRDRLIEVADQSARSGEFPSEPLELSIFFKELAHYVLPIHATLVPPGFPEPKHEDATDMLVASDFWEERGESPKAESLRFRASCIEHCQQLLNWATEQWCEGHPEQPCTQEIVREIVNELDEARFLKKPYGVK